jgi:hypothetical protein
VLGHAPCSLFSINNFREGAAASLAFQTADQAISLFLHVLHNIKVQGACCFASSFSRSRTDRLSGSTTAVLILAGFEYQDNLLYYLSGV